MLHREDPAGLIVITQPMHGWVAAQLARNWGNEQFGTFAPWEEVCLGAEQHDVGMTAWERAPTLNPTTGRPYSFMNMPTLQHVRGWTDAGHVALVQGRYTALLTSLHGTGLYERFTIGCATRRRRRKQRAPILQRNMLFRRSCWRACGAIQSTPRMPPMR